MNTIQVRLLFGDLSHRLPASEWTAWSMPISIEGPGPVQVRHDRLQAYLNPKKSRSSKQDHGLTDHGLTHELEQDVQQDKDAAGVGTCPVVRAEAGAETSVAASVARVISRAETKTLLKVNASKEPSNDVKQRFVNTRKSPFALARAGEHDLSKRVVLNLGENHVYHDPVKTGPGANSVIFHAYLKRILITAKTPNTVMLYSAEGDKCSRKEVPKGFVDRGAGIEVILLDVDQQYVAQVTAFTNNHFKKPAHMPSGS